MELDINPVYRNFFYRITLPMKVAAKGHLDMMKWLVKATKYESIDEWTCVAAAQEGQLETLKWLKEHGRDMNEWVCLTAARNGHLEVLKWARENGASWDPKSSAKDNIRCDASGRQPIPLCLIAQSGHLDVLKYSIDCGGVFHPKTCEDAARGGYLDILKWARENGCSWDEATCAAAALGGHLEILKWARENGAPWDYRTLSIAASKRNMEVLEWVLINGHWEPAQLEDAIQKGGCSVFLWMLDNQDVVPQIRLCSSSKVAGMAIRDRSKEALVRWEKEGFTFDESTWKKAAKNCAIWVMDWLWEKKVPWDRHELFKVAWVNKAKGVMRWIISRVPPPNAQ